MLPPPATLSQRFGRAQTYQPSTESPSQLLTETHHGGEDPPESIAQDSPQYQEKEREQEEPLDEAILSLTKRLQEYLKSNEQSLKDDTENLLSFKAYTEEMFTTQERKVDEMIKTQGHWRNDILCRVQGVNIDGKNAVSEKRKIPMKAAHVMEKHDPTDFRDMLALSSDRKSGTMPSVNPQVIKNILSVNPEQMERDLLARTPSVWDDLAQLDPNYNPEPQGQAHSNTSDLKQRGTFAHGNVPINKSSFHRASQQLTATTLDNTFQLVDFDPLQSDPSDDHQLPDPSRDFGLEGLNPSIRAVESSASAAGMTTLVAIDEQHDYDNTNINPVTSTQTDRSVNDLGMATSGFNADLPSDDDDDFLPDVSNLAPIDDSLGENVPGSSTIQQVVGGSAAYDLTNDEDFSQIATLIQSALGNVDEGAEVQRNSDKDGPIQVEDFDDGASQDSLTSRTSVEMNRGQATRVLDVAPTSHSQGQKTTFKAARSSNDNYCPIQPSNSESSLLHSGRHRAYTSIPAKRAGQSLIPARARAQTQSRTQMSQRSESQSAREKLRNYRRSNAGDEDYDDHGNGKSGSKRRKIEGGITQLAGRGGELGMSDGVRRVHGVNWPKKGANTLVGLLRSIECEKCHGNVHWACAGFEEDTDPGDVEWVCPDCMALILQGKAESQIAHVPTDRCVRPDCIRRAKQKVLMKESDESQYIVESVIGVREVGMDPNTGRKKIECLVKWYGWPTDQATWEPKSSLQRPEIVMLEFHQACFESGVDIRKKIALLPCAREYWDERVGETKNHQ